MFNDIPTPRAESNLTERIAALLLDEITGGKFKPGDVLPPEQVIAERLGVSRTVLREAVSRLKVDGIVSSKQGRGLTVLSNRRSSVLRLPTASADDVNEALAIVELRLGFDIEAAALAAQRHDAADIEEMRAALGQMADAIKSGDVAAGVGGDFRFHRAIAKATRNSNYVTFFDFLGDLYYRNLLVSRRRSAQTTSRGLQAQREHEAIFAAIQSGNADDARRAVRDHVESTGARLRTAGSLLKPTKRSTAAGKIAA